jgi:putative multiple sugar transport system permease protein
MDYIKNNLRQYGLVIALVLIAIFFHFITGGVIFQPMNITNLILQNSYILILAIGMILVIISFGRVDLSVGSIAALAGALSGIFIRGMGLPVWLTIPMVLIIGALCGAWHGFWIAYRNIPFFVVTLGGMMLFRGITMFIMDGRYISHFPDSFLMLATGFVPDIFGGFYIAGATGYVDGEYVAGIGMTLNVMAVVVCVVLALLFTFFEFRKRAISIKNNLEVIPSPVTVIRIIFVLAILALCAFWFGASNGIPNVLVLLAVLAAIYSFVSTRTLMGRHLYAAGGNPNTAELSGIQAKRVVFWVYVNMGFLAALAGMVFTARLNVAMPRAGDGFELQAIAAAFIGGASPSGGVGKVSGALIGALVVGVINQGLTILGQGADIQQIVTGFVLLGAVIFDVVSKRRVERSVAPPTEPQKSAS